ncbi:MAG: TylF/MycF/NovP-related O-methyltransferase [Polyangiaceae bacterium]
MKGAIKSAVRRFGGELLGRSPEPKYPSDFGREDIAVIEAVRPYTMTTPPNMFSLMRAVEYVVAAKIPGSFVECGVWRGGSMMIVAKTLQRLGREDYDLYLYDTFEGMTAPTTKDATHDAVPALQTFEELQAKGEKWCYASLEEVRENVLRTGYKKERVHFVRGPVEETLPGSAPADICLLRLDTDWYQSTKHELETLYPRLSQRGVLIIDDYGHWKGSRQATDEYFAAHQIVPMLNRVDQTSRLMLKL